MIYFRARHRKAQLRRKCHGSRVPLWPFYIQRTWKSFRVTPAHATLRPKSLEDSVAFFFFFLSVQHLRPSLIASRPISPMSFPFPYLALPPSLLEPLHCREPWDHRKLTNLITWTTALSNSMKLWAMLCRATQDGWIMVQSSDRMWSNGKGNGKPLQCSCLENPINSMKSNKIGHWKMKSTGW